MLWQIELCDYGNDKTNILYVVDFADMISLIFHFFIIHMEKTLNSYFSSFAEKKMQLCIGFMLISLITA